MMTYFLTHFTRKLTLLRPTSMLRLLWLLIATILQVLTDGNSFSLYFSLLSKNAYLYSISDLKTACFSNDFTYVRHKFAYINSLYFIDCAFVCISDICVCMCLYCLFFVNKKLLNQESMSL